MDFKITPRPDERISERNLRIPPLERDPAGPLVDTRCRGLRDLRISVTDRCNFRCTYCMPRNVFNRKYQFLPHDEVLTFEEIVRLAKIFRDHGMEKIRLTGASRCCAVESRSWSKCWPESCPASISRSPRTDRH